MNHSPTPQAALPADIRLGPVYLRVRQLARVLPFYRDLLGLVPSPAPGVAGSTAGTASQGGAGTPGGAAAGDAGRVGTADHAGGLGRTGDAGVPEGSQRPAGPPRPVASAPDNGSSHPPVWLAARAGGPPLLCLEEVPGAPPRPPRTTGLYHVALLYPGRADLSRAFLRLVQGRWRFQGFADHGVSEAIYLADPEGNGLELYADRPRDQWPRRNGGIAMYTAPLDLEDLVAAAGGTRPDAGPDGAGDPPRGPVVGHVHLQVSRLQTVEAFYCGVLGFEVTQRDFPGALFVAAGGYHHHLGLNVWAGEGAPPPPPGAAGLAGFTIQLPTAADLKAVLDRARAAGHEAEPSPRGWVLRDPDGIPVFLTT